MDELIRRLEAAADAYPEDVFGAVTDADRRDHGAVVQRAAAQMGRHFAPLLRQAAAELRKVRQAPVAIMDTREFLSLCAPTEDDFPALYALQGQRVRLVKERGEVGGK